MQPNRTALREKFSAVGPPACVGSRRRPHGDDADARQGRSVVFGSRAISAAMCRANRLGSFTGGCRLQGPPPRRRRRGPSGRRCTAVRSTSGGRVPAGDSTLPARSAEGRRTRRPEALPRVPRARRAQDRDLQVRPGRTRAGSGTGRAHQRNDIAAHPAARRRRGRPERPPGDDVGGEPRADADTGRQDPRRQVRSGADIDGPAHQQCPRHRAADHREPLQDLPAPRIAGAVRPLRRDLRSAVRLRILLLAEPECPPASAGAAGVGVGDSQTEQPHAQNFWQRGRRPNPDFSALQTRRACSGP